ncbi:MAG: hypothetical protein CMJ31_10675 [Phycisphaerae bacterium]|jgi:hypothetical protein|nr:hypothetical protein [Phycisphaerae bacterium]
MPAMRSLILRSARASWLFARRAGFVRGRTVRIPRTEPTFPSSRRLIGLNIPLHEARALAEEYELPPIITLDEAAKVARRSPFTVKRLVSEGRFPKSAKPGKPLLFLRDRFIQELMKEHG